MTHTGKCYCGDIRFEFDDPIHSQLLCHCRECRYLSGGEPNASIVISEDKFRVTKGELNTFAREDLENPRTPVFLQKLWNPHLRQKSSSTWHVGIEDRNFR